MKSNPSVNPQDVFSKLKTGQPIWLFLDYDGTLADFAPTPDVIEPQPELVQLLEALTEHPRLHTAIISGRCLQHIEQLVPIKGIWLAGTYGLEIRTPDGQLIEQLAFEKIRPMIEAIKPRWQALLPSYDERFYLEDKGWSLAIHARFAPEDKTERILFAARNASKALIKDSPLHLLGGHKFLEVCPKAARKPAAIQYIIEQQPIPAALPVYIGDDDKDELAFEAVNNMQGVSLVVSAEERPSAAQYRLQDPLAVRKFLTQLSQWLDETETSPPTG